MISNLKNQVGNCEHALQDKVSSDQVQQLCDSVVGVKAKVASMEHTMRSGADRVEEVEGAVASVGSQLAACKQALFERLGNSQATTAPRVLSLDLEPLKGGRSRSPKR